jgi:hypothetical protein
MARSRFPVALANAVLIFSTVTLRRAFAHIAFAFLLLVSQQLGMAHAVSHLSQDSRSGNVQKKQLPAELQCDQCLAFAAIGAGLTGSLPSAPQFLAPRETSVEVPLAKALPAAPRAFDSRAPPVRV